ncbi:hypothetical protein SAMN04488037_1141, partial [Shimia marina]
ICSSENLRFIVHPLLGRITNISMARFQGAGSKFLLSSGVWPAALEALPLAKPSMGADCEFEMVMEVSNAHLNGPMPLR